MKKDFSEKKDYKYFIVFMSHVSKGAKLVACYKVIDKKHISEEVIPKNYPYRDDVLKTRADRCYFELEEIDILKDFEGRLVIDWGGGTNNFKHGGNTAKTKKILSISSKTEKPFPGYENLILPFDELEKVVGESEEYETWRENLRSMDAIYLIVHKGTGKKYVGKASGEDGLLGRWRAYTEKPYTGGNKGIEEFLKEKENHGEHINFQFSILQIFSKDLNDANKVSKYEELYKDKLLTRGEFGLNRN